MLSKIVTATIVGVVLITVGVPGIKGKATPPAKFTPAKVAPKPAGPWGPVSNGLQCRLLPETQVVEVVEGPKPKDVEVYVTYELRNVDEKPVKFVPFLTPLQHGFYSHFNVIGPDGKKAFYVGPKYKLRFPIREDFVTIEPGQRLSNRARMAYRFTESGSYRIQHSITRTSARRASQWENPLQWYYGSDAEKAKQNPDNVWTGTLKSNTVTINVVRPKELAWGEVSNGLQCRLTHLTQMVEVPEGMERRKIAAYVTFELRNAGKRPVKFLPWYTPLEGLAGDILEVIGPDGRKTPYKGKHADRRAPERKDFLTLAS